MVVNTLRPDEANPSLFNIWCQIKEKKRPDCIVRPICVQKDGGVVVLQWKHGDSRHPLSDPRRSLLDADQWLQARQRYTLSYVPLGSDFCFYTNSLIPLDMPQILKIVWRGNADREAWSWADVKPCCSFLSCPPWGVILMVQEVESSRYQHKTFLNITELGLISTHDMWTFPRTSSTK